jgi:hypothetical protein
VERVTRLLPALLLLALALAAPAVASADVTADFEGFAPGTTITNQYADLGGPGLGVTFGPLPSGAGDGFHPVVLAPPAGQAHSGTHVGDVSICNNDPGCLTAEFFTVGTTGTFASGRKHVSVRVGINGAANNCTAEPSTCADVTLKAYNANGAVVGTPVTAHVEAGEGFHKLLSVDVPAGTIRGFSVDGSDNDSNEQIAIDDVSFDVPTTPPPPDFTVTPDSTFLVTRQGGSLTDKIAIARTAGSTGNVRFALSGTLPRGVHASFAPNPAGGESTDLTVTADPDSDVTGFNPITLNVTATPQAATAGRQARSFPIQLQVRSGLDVSLEGPSDVDLSSCVAKVPIHVTRDFGIAGPVSLSVTGATGGVQTRFEPDQITFPGGSAAETTQLVVTGPATGKDVPPQTLTVHASAPPLADRTVQVTVHGACPAQYDARVTGIEITQGTQTQTLVQRDPAHPTSPTRYSDLPDTAELRSGGPTIVRVYANLAFGPMGGAPNVPVLLSGAHYDRFGQQKAIPGGPLSPVSGTRQLDVGPEQTPASEQASETDVYTFVLPPDWVNQKLAIGANLQPSAGGGPLAVAPCDTQPCKDNDHLALTQIPFAAARTANIWPVELTVGGVGQPDPSEVFKWARMTTPIDVTVKPYAGTIDVTDISDKFAKCDAAAPSSAALLKCNDDANNAAGDRVQDYACDHGSDELNWLIGVNTGVARGLKQKDWCWSGFTTRESAVVERQRPTTSVAHEFGHLMGRPHADTACGGEGESWPPDNRGFLQSNGLTTTPGTGARGGQFAVFAPPKQWYDFMSYCADANNYVDAFSGNSWISVRGWNKVFDQYAYRKPLARPVVHQAQGTPRRSLRVSAVAAPSGVSILSVEPLDAPPMPESQSAYHLVAFDAAGQQVADTPMIETSVHVDGEQPSSSLDAVVPVAGVARVAIVRDGATVAERSASASAPKVTDVRVPGFRRTTAVLRWSAADNDGGDLVATIDYSADGGRTFHPVWTGPNKGVAEVPARALPRSSSARVRVTVNDGFREVSARSPRFRSPGAAPVARIISPLGGLKQPNDAPLALVGQGSDDRSRALGGRRLRWLLGKRVLGTGEQVSPAGLPPGRHRIVLEARDSSGRVGRDSVKVTLTGARPLFLALKAPARVSAKARAVHVRVASSLRSTLSVRGPGVRRQRFAVDRHRRTVTVRLRRGTSPLALRFALRSGRATNAQTLTLARR